ncbi:LOW QUALITY PROTEIN: hypothetical protein ACHAW6_001699 [Cyclotella cf. meneghiniana]
MTQLNKTQWVVSKTTKLGIQKADGALLQVSHKADNKIINLIYFTPGCTNPPNLDNTALIDTAANISLLTPTAPALHDATTLPVKTIMQPSGDTITTSGIVFLSLPKLPQSAKQAYQIAGLTNNLLSTAVLAGAGCKVFFHHTGCEVSYNREIILRGLQDPTT